MKKISIITYILAFSFGIASAQNAEGVKHIEEVKKELINAKRHTQPTFDC